MNLPEPYYFVEFKVPYIQPMTNLKKYNTYQGSYDGINNVFNYHNPREFACLGIIDTSSVDSWKYIKKEGELTHKSVK